MNFVSYSEHPPPAPLRTDNSDASHFPSEPQRDRIFMHFANGRICKIVAPLHRWWHCWLSAWGTRDVPGLWHIQVGCTASHVGRGVEGLSGTQNL